jgi:ribose transport system substrate-binding protein
MAGAPLACRSLVLRRLLVAGLVALLAGLAACGSSSEEGAGQPSAGQPSAAQPSAGKDGGSDVTAATEVVEQYGQEPTEIGVKEPLKEAPAKGRTLVFLQCELSQCKQFRDGAAAAAEAIGWNLKTIAFENANPATMVAAMEQALRHKPVAVSVSGLPQAVWKSMIPKYEAAGVAIVPFSVGDIELSKTVPVNISAPDDFSKAGEIMANWVIADSQGRGRALVVDFPAFAVMHAFSTSAVETVKSRCEGCDAKSLEISLAQLTGGSVVSAIVSALRRDPTIKYVLSSEGSLTQGIQSGLKGAGLQDVKIGGGSPTVVDLQALRDGTPGAWTTQPIRYIGWQVVDAAVRIDAGMSVPEAEGGWPQRLLTADTAPEDPEASLDHPSNYQEQFKKLWLVGA